MPGPLIRFSHALPDTKCRARPDKGKTVRMAQDPLNLLCIEPRFPGRLGSVADWLVRKRGYHCSFFCHQADSREFWPESTGSGIDLVAFNVGGIAREASVSWTRQFERALCYAYGAWEVVDARRLRPVDLVLGRSAGLGSTLFSHVTYPAVPVVNQLTYFYHAHCHDLADSAADAMPPEFFQWRRSANAMDLLELESGALAWAPTDWQRQLYPPEYRDDLMVLYDGVDARRFTRREGEPREIGDRSVPAGTKIVSYVAHGPDWTRGFDRFVTLANRLLRERTDVVCVAAGGGTVSRMLDVKFHGRDFRAIALEQEPPHDPDRFWMLGHVSQSRVAELLSVTDLHVEASRVYVASRALVEAMSSAAVVLAWDTAPVREFLEDGVTGLLAADDDAAARKALEALGDVAAHRALGRTAAERARERWSQDAALPRLAEVFDGLAGANQTPRKILSSFDNK